MKSGVKRLAYDFGFIGARYYIVRPFGQEGENLTGIWANLGAGHVPVQGITP